MAQRSVAAGRAASSLRVRGSRDRIRPVQTMRIFVTAKTKARTEGVERLDETHFVVSVKALPIEGKANVAIMKLLARHLGIPIADTSLRSGSTGKHKVFEVG